MKGDQISGLKSREGVRGLTTKDATDDDRGRQEEDGEEEEHGLTGKHWRRGEDIGLRASRPVVRGRGPLSMAYLTYRGCVESYPLVSSLELQPFGKYMYTNRWQLQDN